MATVYNLADLWEGRLSKGGGQPAGSQTIRGQDWCRPLRQPNYPRSGLVPPTQPPGWNIIRVTSCMRRLAEPLETARLLTAGLTLCVTVLFSPAACSLACLRSLAAAGKASCPGLRRNPALMNLYEKHPCLSCRTLLLPLCDTSSLPPGSDEHLHQGGWGSAATNAGGAENHRRHMYRLIYA